MTKVDYKSIIDSINVDELYIAGIEKIYGIIPNEVKTILSYRDNDMFIDDWRVVSKQEIINSEEELYVDFVGKGMIPVFDMMNNDFLCYDLSEKGWIVFNIVDQIKFLPKKNILDYME